VASEPDTLNLRRSDPLPSWNQSRARSAILDFTARVTKQGATDFVPVDQRIAVFDNDGTLWAEQPMYVQLAFALDRLRQLAPQHPEWRGKQPWSAALAGDLATVVAGGERALMEIVAATHAGNTVDEFDDIVARWIATARHPGTRRPYTEMVYRPMLELLAHLRAQGFRIFVVSGGGMEFLRPWCERVYQIPRERVVGSRARMKYQVKDGKPALFRSPEIDLLDDGPGKPVGIQQLIGQRPIAAFGNSDGDFEMLEWTTSGDRPGLGVLIHHTDADREWAYDRQSHFGKLSRALDEAPGRGWHVVDMKRDWATIYPSEG
jgi:phosphoglycolate phosphatase-like HAD superfamily hydrolase